MLDTMWASNVKSITRTFQESEKAAYGKGWLFSSCYSWLDSDITHKKSQIITFREYDKTGPKDLTDNFSFCGIYESGLKKGKRERNGNTAEVKKHLKMERKSFNLT